MYITVLPAAYIGNMRVSNYADSKSRGHRDGRHVSGSLSSCFEIKQQHLTCNELIDITNFKFNGFYFMTFHSFKQSDCHISCF